MEDTMEDKMKEIVVLYDGEQINTFRTAYAKCIVRVEKDVTGKCSSLLETAPELLEALKDLHRVYTVKSDDYAEVEQRVREVKAKADGRANEG